MPTLVHLSLAASFPLLLLLCAPWQHSLTSASSGSGEAICPGRASSLHIVEREPRLVAEDPFGKRFQADLSDHDSIPLLHVYGPPYELGRAHGALLRFEIQTMYYKLFRYMEDSVIDALHLDAFPEMIERRLARWIVNAALDLTYLLTWMFTPSRYVDEMVGLADGANVSFRDVVRIQMVPELSSISGSMIGSWGSATFGASRIGSLNQLRTLDWDMTSPVIDFHSIILFHPADGHHFALFTWSGFIGCVTCYSGMLGISEKVWLAPNRSYNRAGMPWHFVLRDVLQLTKNIEEAKSFLDSVKRTCPLFVGIGSSSEKKFVLLTYSSEAVELYDDSNFSLVTSKNLKPQPRGVIFLDKYMQPSNDTCMEVLVRDAYGVLNSTSLLGMVPFLETGDMHAAVYDFSADVVYFSWAVMDQTTKIIVPAYMRPFLKLQMNSLFELNARA